MCSLSCATMREHGHDYCYIGQKILADTILMILDIKNT